VERLWLTAEPVRKCNIDSFKDFILLEAEGQFGPFASGALEAGKEVRGGIEYKTSCSTLRAYFGK